MYSILIYDFNDTLDDFCSQIKNLDVHLNIEKASSSTFNPKEHHYDEYDMVLIDFNHADGKKAANYIHNNFPGQKIVIINDSLECINTIQNCNLCKKTDTLIKIPTPFELDDFIDILKHKECEFDFSNILLSKLLLLLKKYSMATFDKQTLQILYDNFQGFSRDIFNLTHELREHNIRFSIQDQSIQILQ